MNIIYHDLIAARRGGMKVPSACLGNKCVRKLFFRALAYKYNRHRRIIYQQHGASLQARDCRRTTPSDLFAEHSFPSFFSLRIVLK